MTNDPAALDPAVKVDLWRQRFFEAQAAAEEFILGVHGDEGVSAWIQANSRITADLLQSQRPAGESATVHFMNRLQRQLLLYDSVVTSEPQPSGTVLRNAECGILRYRKQAAGAGVKLTYASPCPYCQELNTAIAARYVESDVTVSCEQAGDGCTWRAESRHASEGDAAGPPDRGGTVD